MIANVALLGALLGLGVSCREASAGTDPTPAGWIAAGSAPADYDFGLDEQVKRSGRSSGHVRAASPSPGGFGTLMQTFEAGELRGKRVRLSAFVKAEGVQGWAGVWMRVDGPEKGKSLAFDNMQRRPIKGTSDWTRYEVVLDVAPEATNIAMGILLHGPGDVWMDDASVEVVDTSVPTTDMIGHRPVAKAPVNLDFER
jgi:hypothetical protein